MDNPQQPTPQPFTDVARPGATPANPSSRPIITANMPQQQDPMMTTAAPVQPPAPSQPTTQSLAPLPTIQSAATSDPQHKFRHDEGHVGHIRKRPMKKRKLIIGFLIIASIGVAFYIMFIKT